MLAIGSTYHRPTRIPTLTASVLVTVLAAMFTAPALSAWAAPEAQAAPGAHAASGASAARNDAGAASTLVITGAGDGHGVGMSQDGAYGYARHGWSDQAILAHYYTGTTIGQAAAGAIVRVLVGAKVQKVPLERYVRGVISAEVPSEWPQAALEAQAIASRTYALTAHAGGSRFDVYSDTRSQVYRGAAAETAQTNAAVAATAGQIVTYAGRPAITYFFASSGGMTEDVQNAWPGSEPQPWLLGVSDPYDVGSRFNWRLSMSFATAAARLQGLVKGRFRGIEVLERGVSPRILTATILGSAGSTQVSGSELAARLGLQDTWAYFGVRSGRGAVKPEPDRSGRSPAANPSATAPTPTPNGPQGGAQAPGGTAVTPAGGVARVRASKALSRSVLPSG
jgi:stage II sporulation protein D